MCVRACVYACVRVCVRACVCVSTVCRPIEAQAILVHVLIKGNYIVKI